VFDDTGGVPMSPTIANSILVGTCAHVSPLAFVRDIESPGNTCNLNGTSTANVSAATLALGPLANNGGLTMTRKPLAGSFAIGKIPAFFCAKFDQRTFVRTAPCDIGSIESDGLDDILFREGFQLF